MQKNVFRDNGRENTREKLQFSCEIVHYRKSSISILKAPFASIYKIFFLERRLGTRLQFHELSWLLRSFLIFWNPKSYVDRQLVRQLVMKETDDKTHFCIFNMLLAFLGFWNEFLEIYYTLIYYRKLQNKEIRSYLKSLTNNSEFLVVTSNTINNSRASKTNPNTNKTSFVLIEFKVFDKCVF